MSSTITKTVHFVCRSPTYLKTDVSRVLITDSEVPWSITLANYNPMVYNSPILENKPWADPDISDPTFKPLWNKLDGKINRKSHIRVYGIKKGYPLNPEGRTGLGGRGVLGKWGPNHAADPIVSRWKRVNEEKCFDAGTKLPILQICLIQRRDCKQWALPGGMVDPGENVSVTLKREFMEEALNSLGRDASNQESLIDEFFSKSEIIYKGYVDDPRNTDNAWMETIAVNFHDEENKYVGKLSFEAGDDAQNVKWVDVSRNLVLYASHINFVKSVAELRSAHW